MLLLDLWYIGVEVVGFDLKKASDGIVLSL